MTEQNRVILIMAGGTGGHVFPGLAVADYLEQLGWRIVWLGTTTGMERRLVLQHGYDMELINFCGLRGKNLATWFMLPLRLIKAFMQSIQIILKIKPNVILGMGGYPAFPGGMMASLLNKPLVIHEQNSLPGLTNKILAKLADKVVLGFPNAINGNDNKIVCLGNPVRPEIAQLAQPQDRFRIRQGNLNLLVVGGSLGAQILNTVVPQALKRMPAELCPMVIHQTGTSGCEAVQKSYADLQLIGEVIPFIDDMAKQYAQCDVIICRAGALTVAELCAAGVASILVPYPHAVDDHQTNNAKFLSDQGAAILLPQSELTIDKLAQLLTDLTRKQLLDISIKARSLAKPQATRDVSEICIELSRRVA